MNGAVTQVTSVGRRLSPAQAVLVPCFFAALLAAFVWCPPVRDLGLRNTFLLAAGVLVAWASALFIGIRNGQRLLTLELAIRRHHWVQACAQGTVFFWWGWGEGQRVYWYLKVEFGVEGFSCGLNRYKNSWYRYQVLFLFSFVGRFCWSGWGEFFSNKEGSKCTIKLVWKRKFHGWSRFSPVLLLHKMSPHSPQRYNSSVEKKKHNKDLGKEVLG